MTLVGFKGKNHPQQIDANGVRDDVDDRGTPPDLFDPLHKRFRFSIDVAAAPHNAKLPRFYTRQQDALKQSWRGERVWCNPPYNARDLAAFTKKAWHEWNHGAELIVMLVPANRPEQAWWQDYVEPFRDQRIMGSLTVEFLRDRRRFIRHDLGHTEVMPNERPPFGVALLIWQDPMHVEAQRLADASRRPVYRVPSAEARSSAADVPGASTDRQRLADLLCGQPADDPARVARTVPPDA